MADTEQRAATIRGLRALADLLEVNPDLILPYELHRAEGIDVFTHSREDFRTWVKALPGTRVKSERRGAPSVVGDVGGLTLRVEYLGSADCELVEDGTEQVEVVEIPDEVKARYTRVEERPKFRRVCPPVLADEPAERQAASL